jgi:AhpD family alkylhydroperoxidase
MSDFVLFDEFSAPSASRVVLSKTRESFNMIPNLERTMALAPALLEAYSTAWDAYGGTSLSKVEQQIVYQTVNFENDCGYCVPWHTLLSQQAGMSKQDVNALRDGRALSSERYEYLRRFTQNLLRQKGKVVKAELEDFYSAGFTPQQALEVVLGIAIKVMSNYTNAIAGTPLDTVVQKYKWRKPIIQTAL